MYNKRKFFITVLTILIFCLGFNLYIQKNDAIAKNQSQDTTSIVLYNSHVEEKYASGKDVVELTRKLEKKMIEKNLNCSYLTIPEFAPRETAFDVSRNLIKQNIKNYNEKILLDIHISSQQSVKGPNSGIRIIVGNKNPNYKENMTYAESILSKLQKANINASIYTGKSVCQNQDLSSKALLIEIGNTNSSEMDIENYLNSLTLVFKN